MRTAASEGDLQVDRAVASFWMMEESQLAAYDEDVPSASADFPTVLSARFANIPSSC